MTHRGVEIVLGRLITDEATRRRFVAAPRQVLAELVVAGVALNPVELAALEAIDPRALRRFAETIDARLLKAELVPSATDHGEEP